jgi:putative phosphoribosyl transferase
MAEAARRRRLYLKNRKQLDANGKVCIVVDDGLATGFTMLAAIKQLRAENPAKIVVAVPVAPAETVKRLSKFSEEIVVLYVPAGQFFSIGSYYQQFDQIDDKTVIALLKNFQKTKTAQSKI